ncbi:MAG: restriction endonuclease [Deltaproteobacteria bacterium]|nr:restriction endonuclease [Deltaproteobacteria bacterium]
MAIWLFRAGKLGEYENKFLTENRIYLTWDKLNVDLEQVKDKTALYDVLKEYYPNAKPGAIRNWTGQVWPIAHEIEKGDWVVLPSKLKSSIHIGEVIGPYIHKPNAQDPFFHYRQVNWFAKDIPRSNFDQDLLYSLGAFMTVCRIRRNNAEKRIREMAKTRWKATSYPGELFPASDDEETGSPVDLEEYAKDQIAKFLIIKFKGHGMTLLIEAILKAKGYVTYRSPEGPDKGIDILAAPEPFGFGEPKLCVQVKTQDTPVDRPTLDQLIGVMQNVKAEKGLLVSWSGFKNTVEKEVPAHFFQIRMWDQDDIIEELLSVYDRLDPELKSDLPLKQIWTLTYTDDESMSG